MEGHYHLLTLTRKPGVSVYMLKYERMVGFCRKFVTSVTHRLLLGVVNCRAWRMEDVTFMLKHTLPTASNTDHAAPPNERADSHIIILSGFSGSGKTTALKAFEDIGYEAIDNPPFPLLVPLLEEPPGEQLVIGVDARTRGIDVPALLACRQRLTDAGKMAFSVIYLDCDEDVAMRRFKETRRRHPLVPDGSIRDGLGVEQRMLRQLRDEADHVLDTSLMSPRELKRWVAGTFATEDPSGLVVQLVSFSYRQGLPREADLVFDVRFLSNPHYDPVLRPLSGLDAAVGEYVQADPGTAVFLEQLRGLLDFVLPRYEQEGKSYLTIAIGCTGGRHRSVYITETLSALLYHQDWPVRTSHRDIDKDRQVQADR